jgi:hypothetical protein
VNQTERNIKEISIKLIVFLSGLFVIFGIPLLIYTFFWTPDAEKARELIRTTSGYYPPTAAKLLYSKNYWESLDAQKPRSMCFAFQYSQKDLIDFQNHSFPHNNNKKEWYSSSPIPIERGCAKFNSNLTPTELALFNKHFEFFGHLDGATIWVNKSHKIIVFETYLFD